MRKKLSPHNLYRLFTFLIISACLSACSEPDNNFDRLLTLDPQVIPYVAQNHWVYATDVDGNILDVKKTNGREQLTLTSARPVGKFNLTIVSSSVHTDGITYINIETYADVDKGSTFAPIAGLGFSWSDSSSVDVKLNGYDGLPLAVWAANRKICSVRKQTIVGGTFNANLIMRGSPSDLLLISYRNGIPVYAKMPGAKNGDQIELDMNNNFTPFEHQRKLDFEGYANYGSIAGAYLDNDGKLASLFLNFIDTHRLGDQAAMEQPRIGYIDGFDTYMLNVTNAQPSGYVSYLKQGDIAASFESFTMPTFSFKVLNTNLPAFAYQFSEDFTYYTANFKYETNTLSMHWKISAPQGRQITLGDIPAEIAAVHPRIRPISFEYHDCTLTKVISGDSYQESILRLQRDLSRDIELYTFLPLNN
ncbi:hypothetical protein [Chryseolinea lacunae]|uniref:Uncharacterized protein n=1 Tax=Chryseolinea lacunae TaxID=2801331 RepID=A0ABS1KPN2_9BACT|nr:hypothetical protein [Chryseolinea lacunae]MBL0741419.1 hypothetical protein [Chryseolinea lacunae]